MMKNDAAWDRERRFWLEGPDFYREALDSGGLMAFPAMGIMRSSDVIKSLKHAPRWTSVEMTNRCIGRSGEDVIILGYAAEASRESAETPYRCLCTSTYRLSDGGWRLVQHHQTPV